MTVVTLKTNIRLEPAEYAVYIYHRPTNQNNPAVRPNACWERKIVTHDFKKAKKEAKTLHRTKQYEKVEVQRVAAAQHYGRQSRILRVYDEYADMRRGLLKVGGVLTAIFGVLGVIAAAYLWLIA